MLLRVLFAYFPLLLAGTGVQRGWRWVFPFPEESEVLVKWFSLRSGLGEQDDRRALFPPLQEASGAYSQVFTVGTWPRSWGSTPQCGGTPMTGPPGVLNSELCTRSLQTSISHGSRGGSRL